MKLSPFQVIASALAAVVSAVLLSFLGDKGTIIGVAIGSIVATAGSAAIAEFLRRGHSAVRQVATRQLGHVPSVSGAASAGSIERAPDAASSGNAEGNVAASPGVARTQRTSPATPGETIRPLARYSAGDRPEIVGSTSLGTPQPGNARPGVTPARTQISAGRAAAGPSRPIRQPSGLVFGMRWQVLLAATLLVAAITVSVVLIIQFASGQSLGHSLGGGSSPTTVPPATVPTTTVTTPTTAPRSFSTTTSPTTTTTTTAPSSPTTTPTTLPSSTKGTSGSSSSGSDPGSGSDPSSSGSSG